MGNCLSKRSREEISHSNDLKHYKDKHHRDHQKPYEEHTHIKRNLRVGIQGEKTPDGEVHIGFKAGLETLRDVVVKVEEIDHSDGFGTPENSHSLAEEEKIPTLKELMIESFKDNPRSIPDQA